MGSVKRLDVISRPTNTSMGHGIFRFSDDFSVFDYGKMPDQIPSKGSALAMLAGVMFERLSFEHPEIASHYIGMVDANGCCKNSIDLPYPSNIMEVKLVNVIRPKFACGEYHYPSTLGNGTQNRLLPLELIYRNSIPAGSSVFKRLSSGKLSFSDLGLTEVPQAGQVLPQPFFELTTKLESTDRPLSWTEAQQISNLTDDQIIEVRQILVKVNQLITSASTEIGLCNEDGKIELAISSDKQIMVVDVFGTPDECRFTYHGIELSKEILRDYYRHTPWYDVVNKAKETAKTEGVPDWKQFCNQEPPHLPPALIRVTSDTYKGITNGFAHRDIFPNTPCLDQTLDTYQKLVPFL